MQTRPSPRHRLATMWPRPRRPRRQNRLRETVPQAPGRLTVNTVKAHSQDTPRRMPNPDAQRIQRAAVPIGRGYNWGTGESGRKAYDRENSPHQAFSIEPMTGIEPAYSAWVVDSSPCCFCTGVVVPGRARKGITPRADHRRPPTPNHGRRGLAARRHGIASALAMCPSKPSDVAIAR